MQMHEILRRNDLSTYNRLAKEFNFRLDKQQKRKKKDKKKRSNIELGDKVENLMAHRAYKRIRGTIRQIKW